MIRPLADIGRWLEELVSPAPQVRFGVDQARQASATMTATDLGPAAADAAGAGPGAVSAEPPAAPAPGRPDPVDQADRVRELILMHAQTYELPFTISCNCGAQWPYGGPEHHSAHVADVVVNMLRADARMAAATNKFRK